jgi:fatty acyl-CoA reductase
MRTLGSIHSFQAKQLAEEVDIIVNGAATANCYERYARTWRNILKVFSNLCVLHHTLSTDPSVRRYDVALASMNVCQFAKQCAGLKMLLHVSTGESNKQSYA